MPASPRRLIDPEPNRLIPAVSAAPNAPQPTGPLLVPVPPLPRAPAEEEPTIPEPHPAVVGALAVHAYEVVDGTRTLMQLGPLVSVRLARRLIALRALNVQRRAVHRDDRRLTPRAAAVRIDRTNDEVAEAAVVLSLGARARGVAIRLEWAHHHWRATELTVL